MRNIALVFIGFLVAILLFGLFFGDNLKVPDTPTAEVDITDTLWMWTMATTPNESLEISDPQNYTLTLLTDGTAQVKADCNNANTTYEIENGNITFGQMASTRAFCGEDSLDNLFLTGLNFTRIYFLQDGSLFFDLEADAGTMKFDASDIN